MTAIPAFLLRPVCAMCILAAIGITVYLYCVHRDLHSHNQHLQALHERIVTLEDISRAKSLHDVSLAVPPAAPPAGAESQRPPPEDDDAAAGSIHSFCSDELRAMLDVIHEAEVVDAAAPNATLEHDVQHKHTAQEACNTTAGAAADPEPDLSACAPDAIRQASYNALKAFLKSKDLSTRGTREALVDRVLQYRVDVDHPAQ